MSQSDLDRDLRSVQEARALARAAAAAQETLETFSQEQIDAIVEAMARAGVRENERLARMAVEETGYGRVPDKIAKNDFVLRKVVEAMRPMRTVGVLRHDEQRHVYEIAEPVGVVAGIIPTTNPTSTAMFKCLIALKARCGIVLSPHPNAKACIKASADVMHEAAVAAGAPRGIVGCMTVVTMEGTQELMRGRDTDVILATGGMGLVRAAYSAGKPAYGVGPGNVPAYIERTADVDRAVRDIIAGTTFDNGTLCSSEQAIICDRAIRQEVVAAVERHGGHFLSPEECDRLARVLITDKLLVNPKLVGQSADRIAQEAGLTIPQGTRVLICPQEGVGPDYPLSHEKLSPVLAFYEVEDWHEGCERCKQLLHFGGLGHTMVIHSRDEEVVLQFGLHKPAHRVLVNTVASVGAVGLTTGLFPSMTLGCGALGNNITSDNIGPQHLINVKRVAYGIHPFVASDERRETPAASDSEPAAPAASPVLARQAAAGSTAPTPSGKPTAPRQADAIARQVDEFLRRRGIIRRAGGGAAPHPGDCGCEICRPGRAAAAVSASPPEPPRGAAVAPRASGGPREATGERSAPAPVDFVAEDDVRRALATGEKIRISRKTIITPLAYELGERHGIFERR